MVVTDYLGCTKSATRKLNEPNLEMSSSIFATSNYNSFNVSCFEQILKKMHYKNVINLTVVKVAFV